MMVVNIIIVSSLVIFTLLAMIFFRASKSWTAFLLATCLLIRMILSIILDDGLKYFFVLDSMTYEYHSWLLAQPWMSSDLFNHLTTGNNKFNYYEIFLAGIFWVFGKSPIIGMIANCFISTASIALLLVIYRYFISNKDSTQKEAVAWSGHSLIIICAVYPSYLIWSTTNTRDPLYIFACTLFFACFFTAFSRRSNAPFYLRLLGGIGAMVSFWLVLGIRNYVIWLFVASIALAYLLVFVSRHLTWKTIFLSGLACIIAGLYGTSILFPDFTQENLHQLRVSREAFANLALLDSVAKSSFGLNYPLETITDFLVFLPTVMSHYFLGPFPWEVSSLAQSMALLEAFAVYLLIYPTILGIKKLYSSARFETITILAFASVFAVAQCLVISNMGTVFRHRSLPFLFLVIFTCEGLYEVAKKNFPSLLKA